MISINASSRYKFNRKLILASAQEIADALGIDSHYSISLAFVGKNKMRHISNTYKHENVALPVLAFPFKEEREDGYFLGEIIICYPQAVLLAAERNKKVDETLISLIEHAMRNLLK